MFFVSAAANVVLVVQGNAAVDASLPTVQIATAIAVNGEASPKEEKFVADGTSTGGQWGFMPASDDPLLMALVPVLDVILFPKTGN